MAQYRPLVCLIVLLMIMPWRSPAQAAASKGFYDVRPATVDCVIEAANRQGVPTNVLLAIASVEAGKNGESVKNSNGTSDLGHFQINTIHFKKGQVFAHIKQEDVAWRGCYNAELAAWLLRRHLDEKTPTDFWVRAANYHSRTSVHNERYRKKLIKLAVAWGEWLQKHPNLNVTAYITE